MRRSRPFAVAVTLVLGLCIARAHQAPGLTQDNFVDVGDSVSQLLDTSGLALSYLAQAPSTPQHLALAASWNVPGAAPRPRKFTRPCPGGGEVKMDVVDADPGGDLSVGDRFKVDFRSCVVEGDVVSGRSEFVIAAHRFEGVNEITELDFRFEALGTVQMRWTGAARASLRSDLQRGMESYVVSYRDLAVTLGAHAMRWNFSLEMVRPPIGEQLARVKGAISVDGLPLQLNQDEPFVIGADGHPRSGQLTASDRLGARLQIEALRRHFAYRLFRAGNAGEAADATSQSNPYGSRWPDTH